MEAAAIITCPECTKRFKGKASLAGKKIKCPFCKEAFVVPKEIAQTAGVVAAPKEEPKKRIVFEDEDEPGAYGVTTLDIAARCPNCANPMADEKAFICLYCGYNTLTRAWGKTTKVFGHTTEDYIKHQLAAYIWGGVLLIFAIGLVFLCLVFPYVLEANTWEEWLDAESIRLWFTVMFLFIFWGGGMFVFKRLIINPSPAELKKD
ncbi:MAG: hypothetical protein U0793_25905 [Gemmataceae bacterium]